MKLVLKDERRTLNVQHRMFLIRSNAGNGTAGLNPEAIVWIIAEFPLVFNPQITPVTPVATRQSPSTEKPAINARQMNPPMRL
jgi:hypothetical protein